MALLLVVWAFYNNFMRYFFCAIYILICISSFSSCSEKKQTEYTPWGETVNEDSVPVGNKFTLSDIVSNGELIMLTLSGPETYYDYHGHGMGLQYLLCERFAQKIGVSLRVEVCKDTAEIVRRLKAGDADVAAFMLPRNIKGLDYCGARVDSLKTQWAVQYGNTELADSLDSWFKPRMIADMRKEESFLLSTRSITRHVYSPMLNRKNGIISKWDSYFMQYSPLCRWDWRLMAAQCYQESTFDPQAHSWAGACGLMQIMPSTADHIGLPRGDMYNPEKNIAGAAKYIRELQGHFSDVQNRMEQSYFVLAAYNGGFYHVRDAMALAHKYGKDSYRWSDVREYILKLSSPAYYNDAVVRHGYMRGSETVDYVDRIRIRWSQYRGSAHSGSIGGSVDMGGMMPSKARRKNRYRI